jgi:hypothetical protein
MLLAEDEAIGRERRDVVRLFAVRVRRIENRRRRRQALALPPLATLDSPSQDAREFRGELLSEPSIALLGRDDTRFASSAGRSRSRRFRVRGPGAFRPRCV